MNQLNTNTGKFQSKTKLQMFWHLRDSSFIYLTRVDTTMKRCHLTVADKIPKISITAKQPLMKYYSISKIKKILKTTKCAIITETHTQKSSHSEWLMTLFAFLITVSLIHSHTEEKLCSWKGCISSHIFSLEPSVCPPPLWNSFSDCWTCQNWVWI